MFLLVRIVGSNGRCFKIWTEWAVCMCVCVCGWHRCLRSTMVSSSITAFLILELGDRVFHELEGLFIE